MNRLNYKFKEWLSVLIQLIMYNVVSELSVKAIQTELILF